MFTVQILYDGKVVTGEYVQGQGVYVPLPDGAEYKIRMINSNRTRCDADISIDGASIGVYRIPAHGTATIERPAGTARCFTFVADNTRRATQNGVVHGASTNGLVTVKFIPEAYRQVTTYQSTCLGCDESDDDDSMMFQSTGTRFWNGTESSSLRGGITKKKLQKLAEKGENQKSMARNSEWRAGGTILGASSGQTFKDVDAITDIDHAMVNTAVLRLVIQAYEPLHKPRIPDPVASGPIDGCRHQ